MAWLRSSSMLKPVLVSTTPMYFSVDAIIITLLLVPPLCLFHYDLVAYLVLLFAVRCVVCCRRADVRPVPSRRLAVRYRLERQVGCVECVLCAWLIGYAACIDTRKFTTGPHAGECCYKISLSVFSFPFSKCHLL